MRKDLQVWLKRYGTKRTYCSYLESDLIGVIYILPQFKIHFNTIQIPQNIAMIRTIILSIPNQHRLFKRSSPQHPFRNNWAQTPITQSDQTTSVQPVQSPCAQNLLQTLLTCSDSRIVAHRQLKTIPECKRAKICLLWRGDEGGVREMYGVGVGGVGVDWWWWFGTDI